MKLLGILITACVVLAAAQATLAVICVMLLAWVVFDLFFFPREMLGLIALLAIVGLFQTQPLACLGVVALMIIAKLVVKY